MTSTTDTDPEPMAPITTTRGGVTVSKTVRAVERDVLAVELAISSALGDPARVTLVENLPAGWPGERVGIRRDSASQWYHADDTLTTTVDLDAEGRATAVYAVRLADPDDADADADAFRSHPTLDVSRQAPVPPIGIPDGGSNEVVVPRRDSDDEGDDPAGASVFEEFNRQFEAAEARLVEGPEPDEPGSEPERAPPAGDPEWDEADLPSLDQEGEVVLVDPTAGITESTPDSGARKNDSSPAGESPAPAGESPAPDGESPAPDDESPASDDESPAPDGESATEVPASTDRSPSGEERSGSGSGSGVPSPVSASAAVAVENRDDPGDRSTDPTPSAPDDPVEDDFYRGSDSMAVVGAGAHEADDADQFEVPSGGDDSGAMLRSLASALAAASPEAVETIRGLLAVENPAAMDARLRHVQGEVDDLVAYREALVDLLDDHGATTRGLEVVREDCQALRESLTRAEATVQRLETAHAADGGAFERLEAGLDGALEAVDSLGDTVVRVERGVEAHRTDTDERLEALAGRLDRVEGTVEGADGRVSATETRVAALSQRVDDVDDDVDGVRSWQTAASGAFERLPQPPTDD